MRTAPIATVTYKTPDFEEALRRLRAAGNGGPGTVVVLNAVPAGMSAKVAADVAQHVGLDLYRIDLGAIVGKFIGETEKNLDRVFGRAEQSNAILFFDQADALFGKRSEVKDAHDRFSNVEVNYLLQKLEAYPGLAVMAMDTSAALEEMGARRRLVIVKYRTG